jgi:hypothetical protein
MMKNKMWIIIPDRHGVHRIECYADVETIRKFNARCKNNFAEDGKFVKYGTFHTGDSSTWSCFEFWKVNSSGMEEDLLSTGQVIAAELGLEIAK